MKIFSFLFKKISNMKSYWLGGEPKNNSYFRVRRETTFFLTQNSKMQYITIMSFWTDTIMCLAGVFLILKQFSLIIHHSPHNLSPPFSKNINKLLLPEILFQFFWYTKKWLQELLLHSSFSLTSSFTYTSAQGISCYTLPPCSSRNP